jgi:hypothetical protein
MLLRRLHGRRAAFAIDLRRQLGGQREIEVQVQREQRALSPRRFPC